LNLWLVFGYGLQKDGFEVTNVGLTSFVYVKKVPVLLRVLKGILFFVGALVGLMGMAAVSASTKPQPATPVLSQQAKLNPKTFQLVDNIDQRLYKVDSDPATHKPDTALMGMVRCDIIYLDQFTKKKGRDAIPDEQTYRATVRAHNVVAPGPIVLDIESLNLTGASGSKNIRTFIDLVKWTHEAAPGCIVGYYGHGLFPNPPDQQHMTEAKELARAVDAFFPSMYVFDDNRGGWKSKLESLIKQAHALAPGKPVYPYIWPQYHGGSKKQGQFVSGDYWTFQLQTARACGANGAVIWLYTHSNWDGNAPWWQSTVRFATELKAAKT
jgi:hypothetical protein